MISLRQLLLGIITLYIQSLKLWLLNKYSFQEIAISIFALQDQHIKALLNTFNAPNSMASTGHYGSCYSYRLV